ncbi:hypothetical protein Scep_014773 [Stephania cephalantha]|uniref:Uncharacterized protein n=1 Tax=Stephania cephalantha TaxID=152367 RepID=A0AAP0J3Z7_9MAGN
MMGQVEDHSVWGPRTRNGGPMRCANGSLMILAYRLKPNMCPPAVTHVIRDQ